MELLPHGPNSVLAELNWVNKRSFPYLFCVEFCMEQIEKSKFRDQSLHADIALVSLTTILINCWLHPLNQTSVKCLHDIVIKYNHFSPLLAICAGNSPVTGEFPTPRPVILSFDSFFDLRLNKRLSKQSWGWWFETPSRSLWCYCNDQATNNSFKLMLLMISYAKWRPCCSDPKCANFLWPSDGIWRRRRWSAVAQVMACCLAATDHYVD